jgi:hypothetical protein
MTGFLPENPGVIKVEVVAEIRRLHFVEKVTVSESYSQVWCMADLNQAAICC